MNDPRRYDGTRIGILFMLACLAVVVLLNITLLNMLAVLVGVVSVGPISLVESITSGPASATIVSVIIFAVVLIAVLLVIRSIASKEKRVPRLIIGLAMLLMYFPLQVLGFYIYWGLDSNFQGGNQALMLSMHVAPMFSWVFVLIGLAIDGVKNKGLET